MKRIVNLIFLFIFTSLFACTSDDDLAEIQQTSSSSKSNSSSSSTDIMPVTSDISSQWKYDSSTDTYYIVGVVYCDNPADESYEQMGIYVPGAYMNGTRNSDGTYTCTINSSGEQNGYNASTAPIVIPVDTAGYKAMSAPTGFSSNVTSYTKKGFVYLHAGCRGKESSAPSAVTDLKAAVRYFRFLAAAGKLPGCTDRIFSFGHSGGGAQSAIFGTTGNSSLYNAYLEDIGAKMEYKDDIMGSMCWCPITNLDQANGAYEWNMGQTRSGLSSTDQDISKALAGKFAEYINAIGFKHPTTGATLTLSATDDGYYQSGSYYEYIIEVINDAVARYNEYNGASVSTYDPSDATSLSTFAKAYKNTTKGLGAFDAYDGESRTSAGNLLFDPEGVWSHFDKYLAEVVAQYVPQYKSVFDADLAQKDKYGNDLDTRLGMYTPLFYLMNNNFYYAKGGTSASDVAPYWRIRTGIKQGDTSLCTEVNLALGLFSCGKNVDFETIWDQGHTQAEDTGDATDNFIEWVKQCCQ
ncbi:MAG: hypothetical protein K5856_08085 [Bacteroidaceae bacterium]|nr:hypothetical protein [Bacteroidaceae bacterium]